MVDSNLKKEVQGLLAKGFNEAQIKQEMTSKGYSISDINKSMQVNVENKPKVYKNHILIIVGLILIVVIIIILSIINFGPKFIDYSNNPKDWVIDKEDGVKEIEINLVSEATSFIDEQGQQFRSPEVNTMFFSYGYYQGNYFQEYYSMNGEKQMSITTEMSPGDGIIEGYAVFKIINGTPAYYIFVDEDWKQKVLPTKIYYGFDHSDVKDFEFKEISDGIYMDLIYDDQDNYDDKYKMHFGSIIVGDATEEKINSNNNNLTLIVIK